MSELRHDVLTGRLVLLSPGRATRPFTNTADAARATASDSCPFCPGHEHETPPEVARTGPGEPDTPGWRVRVVPNLYPIVGGAAALTTGAGTTGAHEVIIFSPAHDATFGDLDDDQAVEVFTMLRERARFHAAAGRAYSQILVNEGRAAGASMAHPHAQLLALDFVPPAVTVAVERFAALDHDPLVTDEADAAGRDQGVIGGKHVRAWCPTGAASPYEVRLAAFGADARFEDASDGEVLGVALVLRDALARLARALGPDTPYNVILHNGPASEPAQYHWWLEILPRISVVAGFELGTALLVNTVDPRDAASRLRNA